MKKTLGEMIDVLKKIKTEDQSWDIVEAGKNGVYILLWKDGVYIGSVWRSSINERIGQHQTGNIGYNQAVHKKIRQDKNYKVAILETYDTPMFQNKSEARESAWIEAAQSLNLNLLNQRRPNKNITRKGFTSYKARPAKYKVINVVTGDTLDKKFSSKTKACSYKASLKKPGSKFQILNIT